MQQLLYSTAWWTPTGGTRDRYNPCFNTDGLYVALQTALGACGRSFWLRVLLVWISYLLVFLTDQLLRLGVGAAGHHGNGEVGAALPGQFAARSKTAHACMRAWERLSQTSHTNQALQEQCSKKPISLELELKDQLLSNIITFTEHGNNRYTRGVTVHVSVLNMCTCTEQIKSIYTGINTSVLTLIPSSYVY